MALTGDQIEEITRSVVELYRGAEAAIVQQVAAQLAQGMDADDWAVNRLGALSTLRRAVEAILGLVADEGAESIRETLARAYRTGSAAATTGLPAELLPRDPAAVQAAAAASEAGIRAAVVENLAVALVQDIGVKHSNVLRHVTDVYRSVIQQASAVSVAGGMTRRDASQWAWQRFVDQGVTSFVDARGRTWRLSSYVEMATRTVTQRAAVQGQTDRLQRLGVDTVIVSNSPRECPKCRPWEGQILSISGGQRGRVELESKVRRGETVTVDIAGSVEEARAAGLQHPNCTHALRAYLAGATRVPTGDLSDPKGYQAKERQREIERQIRRYKERQLAALTPEAKAAAAAKVRQWQGAMRDHLKANPALKRLPYRETPGAGNVPRQRPPGTAQPAPTPPAPQPTPVAASPEPPAAPPAPAVPASVRKPATRTLDEIRAEVSNPAAYHARQRQAQEVKWDPHLQAIGKLQGFDALPRVGTRAEVDTAVASGWTEVWRGVVASPTGQTAAQINQGLRFGDYQPGTGLYGNGWYLSVRRNTAETFRGREPKTNFPARPGATDFEPADLEGPEAPDDLLRIAVDPAARIATLDDIKEQMRRDGVTDGALADPGRWAAAVGYDGMRVIGQPDGGFHPGWEDEEDERPGAEQIVIFNRSVLLIQRAEDAP